MLDAAYFRTRLLHDVEASGSPVVEVFLRNGQSHRVRRVAEVTDGYVVLEAFQLKGDQTIPKANANEEEAAGRPGQEVYRAIVPYESIVAVTVDQTPASTQRRLGFFVRS